MTLESAIVRHRTGRRIVIISSVSYTSKRVCLCAAAGESGGEGGEFVRSIPLRSVQESHVVAYRPGWLEASRVEGGDGGFATVI